MNQHTQELPLSAFVLNHSGSADFCMLTQNWVDGEPWYRIACSRAVCDWLRTAVGEHEHQQWQQHNALFMNYNLVDVDQKIYTMLMLRWS